MSTCTNKKNPGSHPKGGVKSCRACSNRSSRVSKRAKERLQNPVSVSRDYEFTLDGEKRVVKPREGENDADFEARVERVKYNMESMMLNRKTAAKYGSDKYDSEGNRT